MSEADAPGFEAADDRTLYWTLSLYIRPEKLWDNNRPKPATGEKGDRDEKPLFSVPFDRDRIAALQLAEPVSLALRNAIEPLFNDISDRESGGKAIDFLLAVEPDAKKGREGERARASQEITFYPPGEIAWTTEGQRFAASTRDLADQRTARLRRFWFVHADGAISWHLSLTLDYRHDPADYLFLAMLQKLAAPKEFSLDPETLRQHPDGVSVFDDVTTGIGPLDRLKVRVGRSGKAKQRFWPALKVLFDGDLRSLANRIAAHRGCPAPPAKLPYLLDNTGLIEVPGLTMPRCRTMMYFRDKRFFERLSPKFDADDKLVPRRRLVQDGCYVAYADELEKAIDHPRGGKVKLDDDSLWTWVRTRPDYAGLSKQDETAIREGSFVDDDGTRYHIPTFDLTRTDCLDYLFLSGFNQNIIDFMNQDPSEILDGTDPIYPTDEDQAREGFFVRFANHRSMITYAEKSRSLEVGNDYIGTCPYAFLVHVLSMHNEFLARDFEEHAIVEVAGIEKALADHDGRSGYGTLSGRINALKIARYRDYEQHRYVNVFRYDTERDVFAELEQLRGVKRKETALELALSALEDHADDLESQRASERERNIGAIAFVLSALALAQGFDMLADIAGGHRLVSWSEASWSGVLRAVAAGLLVLLIGTGLWLMIARRGVIVELLKPRSDRKRP